MIDLKEKLVFLRQLQSSFDNIGAVLPTSPSAAEAMVREILKDKRPKRILEVGPGTGAVTARLVELMQKGDELVLCELNAGFVDFLERRFEREPAFQRVRDQVKIVCSNVIDLLEDNGFNYIVSSLPFSRLEPALVREILEKYKRMLLPAGVLTFIEYQYLRKLSARFTLGTTRDRLEGVEEVVRAYVRDYAFRCEPVIRNIPPAVVYNLRFTAPLPGMLRDLSPSEHRRMSIGGFHMNDEAVPLVAGLASLSWLASRLGKGRWAWIPAVAAAAVAVFHRDPVREIQVDHKAVLSAADGRVLEISKAYHPRLGSEKWTRIAVFLSITDVHINRAPIAGTVVDSWDEPGGFALAFSDAAVNNFSRYIVLQGENGRCAIAQRAGALARKIVTWCDTGALLAQGERYGMIRFGSRVDVFLPYGATNVLVREGDMVRAGETVLAYYR